MQRDTLDPFHPPAKKKKHYLVASIKQMYVCSYHYFINRDGPPTIAFDYFVVDKTTTKHFSYHTATCKVHTNAFSDKSVSTKESTHTYTAHFLFCRKNTKEEI